MKKQFGSSRAGTTIGHRRHARRGWLRALRAAIVGGLGAAAAGGAAAGGPALVVEVVPLADAVNYSTAASLTPPLPGFDSYVAYTVTVRNQGWHAVEQLRFAGATTVTDADERASIASVEGAACTIGADAVSVECPLGRLEPGASSAPFTVVVRAPQRDPVSPLAEGVAGDCAATDCVGFAGQLGYVQVRRPARRGKPQAECLPWTAPQVALATARSDRLSTVVPTTGAELFTGSGGASSDLDPFTTAVTVPASPASAPARIVEATDPLDCGVRFSVCFVSEITIPGAFDPYLRILLRQDASTILKRTRIEDVQIYYTGATYTGLVRDCVDPDTPSPVLGEPCIAERVVYRKAKSKGKGGHGHGYGHGDAGATTPGWTPELDGDFEWTILNTGNGSYKVF